MAKTDQKYLIDRDALEHLIALLRHGLSKGANDEEIWDQAYEILDLEYRTRTDQSFKEMKDGKVRQLKSAEEMIKDLESR